MDSLKIIGGNPIKGQIKISGAKNAALPLMACGLLLNQGTLKLSSMPNLADTKFMCLLLKSLGIKADIKNNVACFKGEPTGYIAQYDIVRKMRASILVLGPLLTRLGVAKVSLPGGCSIGTRPVDLHINALEKMGAKINYINKRISNNEMVCDMEIESSNLNGCELDKDMAKLMIDEYPVLSIAASFANTPSIFRGLSELRVKESDRLDLIQKNLVRCGVDAKTVNDDLLINPNTKYEIKNNKIFTNYDHRIAMSFAVMGSKIGPLEIEDANSINTSFPSFINEFNNIGGKIT